MNGQKALVTGAGGFIGGRLCVSLLEAGYDVRAFVLYNSFNSYGWLDTIPAEVKSKIEFFAGEDYHQDYFEKNPNQGYCVAVAGPKVAKFRKTFTSRYKD